MREECGDTRTLVTYGDMTISDNKTPERSLMCQIIVE